MRGNKGGEGWLRRVRCAATGLHNSVRGIVLCGAHCSTQNSTGMHLNNIEMHSCVILLTLWAASRDLSLSADLANKLSLSPSPPCAQQT